MMQLSRAVVLTTAGALLLVSCDNRPPATERLDARAPESATSRDTLAIALTIADSAVRSHLQAISPRLSARTTHVYSPFGEDSNSAMHGRAIGPSAERVFAPQFGNAMSDGEDIYAVGWFPLTPRHEVYLLRTPSQYDVSALTLWAYDIRKGVWSSPLEIADRFGDAGWRFRKEAWITPSSDGTDVSVVVHRLDANDDIESDTPKPTVGPDSLYEYSLRVWLDRGFYRTMLPLSRATEFPFRKDP